MGMTKKDKEMQALKEYCEKKRVLKLYLESGHRVPKTRREFMGSGVMTFAATLAAPTLGQLITSSAWAQTGQIQCNNAGGGGNANARPLFVHVQLAGGAALYAQAQMRGAGGNPLPSYGRLGVGPNPNIAPRFANNVPFVTRSNFFQAMDARLANTNVYQNASMVHIAAASVDDSSNNRQDISGMLEAANIIGSKLPFTITGSNNSRFRSALLPQANFLRVQNAGSMEGALGVAGALGRLPGNAAQQNELHVSLVSLIEDLNKNQVEALAADPLSIESQKVLNQMVQCASKKNVENMASQENVDFLDGNVPAFADAAGYAAAFQSNNGDVTAAGQAIGAGLSGLTGAVLVEMGGYDYHLGRNRGESDARDTTAGDMCARILQGAEAAGRPIFILVSSDGSVSSPNDANANDQVNWRGDSGRRGSAYMISYNPGGATPTAGLAAGNYADADFQLGHFSGTEVSGANPLSALDAQELFASAVFLNYLSAAGLTNLIDSPGVGAVKSALEGSLPAGVGSMLDFYTRFKS